MPIEDWIFSALCAIGILEMGVIAYLLHRVRSAILQVLYAVEESDQNYPH